MSAITAKARRKMKKYAVLTREPRCFLGSFDFSWEQRKLSEMCGTFEYGLNAAAKEFDGNNKYIRITDIDDASREFLLSDLSSPDICLDGMSKYLLSSGDIVFARTGASVGKTYIYRENDGIVYFAGFLIRAKVNQDNDAEFVFQSTLSPSYEKYIRITSQRSGQPGVNAQEYGEYDLFAPSKEEQQRIGHFLRGIDNLITLHQRKCVFLFSFFRACISMNFTASTFSWEQRKLSEITDKVTEKNAGLQYVETFTNSAEFGIISQRDFFDHDIAKLGSLDGYYIVKNEDFVYNPRISTSAPVGPINRNKLGRTGVMSPLYTVFRPHDIDTTYLEYFFKCGYWHSFMNFNGDSGARSDRFSIRDNVFFQMPIPIPDIDEQRKIGELLTCLDNLITLHQRECISFTGSAGRLILTANKKRITSSWEQRKLGELALFNPKDELPQTFEYVDLESVVGTEMLSHRTEVKSSAPSRAQRLAHTGDLFYQTVRPYQKNNYLFEKPDNNYVFSTGYAQMRPYVDGYFLLSLVQSERFVKVVLDNCTGTSYPAINANDLAEIEVAAPSDESEARKIGTIFRSIDNLITLHQRKPFLMKWRTSDANRNQTNRLVL